MGEWVINFTTSLRASEVDVILDKWDLKEGCDANAFMEQMVSDPEIKNVINVSDRVYKEKADDWTGGVTRAHEALFFLHFHASR